MGSTIVISGVRTATEARLRAEFQDVEFVPLPAGRTTPGQVPASGTTAAIVGLDADVERGFHLVRELSAKGMRVVVVGPTKDPDLILRAMREGAKEFVLAADDDALTRSVREIARSARPADAGRIHAVFGAKGGVGATTVATNLAGAFQRAGHRTCLVDLNLNMGDVLAFLDLAGGYSIADVIANMRRLDRGLLDSSLLRHASGIRVLAQSHRLEEADRVDGAALGSMLRFLRQHYDAVVLDGLRSFDELTIAAVDASDSVLVVVTQEVPAVRDARRCVQLLNRLGAEQKLKVVVNRFQKGVEITPEVVAETVGLAVATAIPNDYPAVIRCVNRGLTLLDEAPKSPVTRGIEQLAATYEDTPPAPEPRERPSLLKRFLSVKASHATE